MSQIYVSQSLAAETITPLDSAVVTVSDTTDDLPLNAGYSVSQTSADGNVLLIRTASSNLVGANTNGGSGYYVFNVRSGSMKRVDIANSGVPPNGVVVNYIKMSETGRYVAFASSATNLIDGATRSPNGMYIRDTQLETTSGIGLSTGHSLSQNWDRLLDVSNDGRFILAASRYVANQYPNRYGIILGEKGATGYNWSSLHVGDGGGPGSYGSSAVAGDLSCDGAFAVYQKYSGIELADLRRGTTVTVSAAGYNSISPMISCNGRYVLYATNNRTEIPTPSQLPTHQPWSSHLQLARYDRITGERVYVSRNAAGDFSDGRLTITNGYDPEQDIFRAMIADTGDVLFTYKQQPTTSNLNPVPSSRLKHLSDGSNTLESIAKKADGTPYEGYGILSGDGGSIFFSAEPYDLGLTTSPVGPQIIRT